MPTALVSEDRWRISTRVSKSNVNINRWSQFGTSGVVYKGHLRRNCFKLNSNKGDGIRVEFTNNIATITDNNSDNNSIWYYEHFN